MGAILKHPTMAPLRHLIGLPGSLLLLVLGGTTSWGQSEPLLTTYEGDFVSQPKAVEKPTARAGVTADAGSLYNINSVVVVGDRQPVLDLPNWEHYENEALYEPMSEADIEAFRQRILKDLQDRGYVFATVSVYKPSLIQGFLKIRVHLGQLGKVTVKGNKYRSAEQILKGVNWNTGQSFDYSTLFQRLYAINTNPGVQITSQLKPRQEEGGRRIIDAEFSVKERIPVTGALTISNDGFAESGEWRGRVSAQWFNPLRMDDTLGLEWATSLESVEEVNAIHLSYILPLGEKTKLSAFGGYSQNDLSNVLPLLDLVGKGYFMGAGLHFNLYDSEKYSLDVSAGWMFLNSENKIVTGGDPLSSASAANNSAALGANPPNQPAVVRYKTDLSMPRISISWSAKEYDSWGGRNFLSNTLMFNVAGFLGSSGQKSFLDFNPQSDGTFIIDRFQFARFQKLWGKQDETGSFSLFTRFDAQIASKSVPSSLYKSIGGADSIRGYHENTEGADMGYEFSLELRTPLIANFIRGMQKSEEFLKENPDYWGLHRLQALVFFETGTVAYVNDPSDGKSSGGSLFGQSAHVTLSSIGGGLRMTMTKYAQFKIDYGYPLQTDPKDVPMHGRVHFSGQIQF